MQLPTLLAIGAMLMAHTRAAQPDAELYAGFTLADPAAQKLTPDAGHTRPRLAQC